MSKPRIPRRVLIAVGAVVLVPISVLAVEVQMARTAPRLADNVGFRPVGRDLRPGADPVHVLWLGDSTSTGVGTDELGESMAARVALGLGEQQDRGVQLTVLGRSGAQVHEVLDDQLPALADLVDGRAGPADLDPVDVVFVSIGANDVTALTRRTTFEGRYREMVRRLDATLDRPATEIVLVGIPDMGTAPRLPVPLRQITGWRAAQLDRVVSEIAADRGVHYVDLAERTSGTFSSDPDRFFSDDDFHPSADGHEVWADAVLDSRAGR